MKPPEKESKNVSRRRKPAVTALVCLGLILAGFIGMNTLARARKPLPEKAPGISALAVDAVIARSRDVVVFVKGYGQAVPFECVDISPEVSGTVSRVSPNLVQGGQVKKGEILFEIDAGDYAIAREKAGINLRLQDNRVRQLTVEYENDRARLPAVQRTTALARADHLRLKHLFEQERVGTLAGVEGAEQTCNTLLDAECSLIKSIELYPLKIREAEENRANAGAELETASLNLERCTVRAPFDGRIREELIEPGMYLATGARALTLANDNLLEIQVSLSEDDCFGKLGLGGAVDSGNWFEGLEARPCRVETVTGKLTSSVRATIHRIVKYDPGSRTLLVAVRISGDSYRLDETRFPVVDGMFCTVFIPGKTLSKAIKVPVSVVNDDNTVFIAENGRLRTVAVDLIMEDGDQAYITGNIPDGTPVITTRLAHPLENQPVAFGDTRMAAAVEAS
ncbi:MAG: biotin/lipoyl-binding protein [Desulfobacteraceae bacterium]|nr:biotin/lipoyl-binding protein [Desulfobacteraceae bacterium]